MSRLAPLRTLYQRLRLRADIGAEPWRGRTLWALDLETGGLDPRSDPILSVGMVAIRDGAVALGECYHTAVLPNRPIGRESLLIHHLLPDELEAAPLPAAVLPDVARRIDGGIMVVHEQRMDVPFLDRAFRGAGIERPPFLVVDTVRLLLRYAHRHGHLTPERRDFPTGLADARARFGLPPHRAHEALSDAVATAELFLVLAHRLRARTVAHLL